MRHAPRLLLAAVLAAAPLIGTAPALALQPATPGPEALQKTGEPVTNIPTADSIEAFTALDNEHVMVSLADRQQYLVTLNRQCIGLRWAKHVAVSASDNTIWAGFDALTADGRSCPIREIHRLPDASEATFN